LTLYLLDQQATVPLTTKFGPSSAEFQSELTSFLG